MKNSFLRNYMNLLDRFIKDKYNANHIIRGSDENLRQNISIKIPHFLFGYNTFPHTVVIRVDSPLDLNILKVKMKTLGMSKILSKS